MRHSSESALNASSGGVCDFPAPSTIVQRVEVNRPSRVVSGATVAAMRRFINSDENKQDKCGTDARQRSSLTPALKPVRHGDTTTAVSTAYSCVREMKAVETALTLVRLCTGLKAGVNEIQCSTPHRSTSPKLLVLSDHAELHSPGFADHVLVPWRIPDELHIGFIDTVYA